MHCNQYQEACIYQRAHVILDVHDLIFYTVNDHQTANWTVIKWVEEAFSRFTEKLTCDLDSDTEPQFLLDPTKAE